MPQPYFPVTHTTLAGDALLHAILPAYDIGAPRQCKLLQRLLNDTYLVETEQTKYILRVYRAGWRTEADIRYEIDLLNALDQHGIPVATPVPRRDGDYLCTVSALEGLRPLVLFTYAEGAPPEFAETAQMERYSALLAQIHTLTTTFSSPHSRFPLDLDHLLYSPLTATLPHLSDPADRRYLEQVAPRLVDTLNALPLTALDYGVCHGDTHNGNIHIDPHGAMKLFDFDCCGVGWRAYDLATFYWAATWERSDSATWTAFLTGYTDRRPLQSVELAAIPLFACLRQIWFMGLRMANGPQWGYRYPGVTQEMPFLRRLVAEWTAE
jgi:Ser/Thr protein kinase RdoA (MazF antagonist)